jgi:hypothetical protein
MGILPASKWRFLKHLSLADNSLTAIPAASLNPLANTLNSLDLSSNLFTQIPDSLATLTALRALNLAHCMIDSLHSLTRNPLPAITALNLRANRLQSIAGVEKLLPLERLDLRDNRLTDPMELARLTGIPEIREIWVEGNPFTRTHRDYRITIFNLFRQTPGYTEDITIDTLGPTSAEKRYLVERAEVPPAIPVIKPEPPEIPAVDVSRPAIIYDPPPKEPAVLRKERPLPKAASSEVNTSSTRRRRAPKRRIVDLATNDSPMPYARPVDRHTTPIDTHVIPENHYRTSHPPEAPEAPAPRATLAESPLPNSPEGGARQVPRIDTNVTPQLPSLFASPGSNVDWDVGGELYRQKIEDLRHKVGNGYLSVLSEEGWDAGSHPPEYRQPADFGAASPSIHSDPTIPRANMQAISSGGTL